MLTRGQGAPPVRLKENAGPCDMFTADLIFLATKEPN